MMKRILLAVALCVPFLASAEDYYTGSDEAAEQLTSEELASTEEARLIPPLLQYCWEQDNTACTSLNATQNCTDGIWSDYVCTCRLSTLTQRRAWDCPEVR
ncbi:hypothetical protein LXT21_35035 [Myxococcus sp. K38C18041901]|uniref:hypothetical protein n=1 Tax=Myxococcus guangdongensis TaxID=2906760 RepID=UPI0020A78B5F|nr:hypothetical protein [Myxococcus guangdongensis]MCP3064004.1 hypothetical protein [Myxococcus guangdongensis]